MVDGVFYGGNGADDALGVGDLLGGVEGDVKVDLGGLGGNVSGGLGMLCLNITAIGYLG